jgi:hypothetical protein
MLLLTVFISLFISVYSYADRADCSVVDSPHLPSFDSNGGHVLSGIPPMYIPGETYTITIQGGNDFKGLLLYAKNSNGLRYGTFTANDLTQLVKGCNGGDGN